MAGSERSTEAVVRFEEKNQNNSYRLDKEEVTADDSISVVLSSRRAEVEQSSYRCKHFFTQRLDWIPNNKDVNGFIDCPNEKCEEKLGIFCFDGIKCQTCQ